MHSFPKNLVVDTGFWIALFDPRDEYYPQAGAKEDLLNHMNILVPWPSLYETLNTRFCRNARATMGLESLLRQPHFSRIDDTPYREEALEISLRWSKSGRRAIALVDMVIRLLLDDINVKTDALLTFNAADFVDVCRSRRIEML